jgi:hypothetical protein
MWLVEMLMTTTLSIINVKPAQSHTTLYITPNFVAINNDEKSDAADRVVPQLATRPFQFVTPDIKRLEVCTLQFCLLNVIYAYFDVCRGSGVRQTYEHCAVGGRHCSIDSFVSGACRRRPTSRRYCCRNTNTQRPHNYFLIVF